MQITEEQADQIGRMADKMDSLLAGSKMPIPASIHLEAWTGSMREMRDELAALVVAITGENPWETNPLES